MHVSDALAETLLPDFVLALTFFTALAYAVLSKRFGRQRPAVAMSAALALALSTGLVWWERSHGKSIRDLGPFAIGLASLLLCVAVFHAIRQIGGIWAGVALGVGASLVVSWMLGLGAALAPQFVWASILMTLAAGLVALLIHLHRRSPTTPIRPVLGRGFSPFRTEMANARDDLDDLRKDRRVGESVWQQLRKLRKDSELLAEHPGDARNIMEQLRRMLPPEGWLTERLARLRARAYRVREGHVARIEELRHAIGGLSGDSRKRAAQELTERYRELKLDIRLERLDRAVAKNERQIRNLTREAEQAAGAYDYRRLTGLLESAERLQRP